MENLKRYDFDEYDSLYGAKFIEDATGEYVKFSDIKEILNTSTNSASPKLPTLVECERWYIKEKCGFEHITELEKNVIREIHDYICRQLRACA